MMVRFAVVCDVCETRGYEYGGGYHCRECGVEMCDRCGCPQAKDEETGRAYCPDCANELGIADGADYRQQMREWRNDSGV